MNHDDPAWIAWQALPLADQLAYFSRRHAEAMALPRDPNDPTRLAMRAELCEFGSGPCGCGTGPPRRCSRPGRPSLVRRADCLACVAEEG